MGSARAPGGAVRFAVAAAGAVLAGVINGILGTGAGTVFYFVCLAVSGGDGDRSKDDLSTAMAAVFPLSAVSLFTYRAAGAADAMSFFTLVLPAFAGGLAGAHFAGKMRGRVLKSVFAAVSVAGGINMLLR